MSKRFVSLKREFKKNGRKMNNRSIRHYLHNKELTVKMVERFIKWSNSRKK